MFDVVTNCLTESHREAVFQLLDAVNGRDLKPGDFAGALVQAELGQKTAQQVLA
ncbi:MAG: hypothetical protein NZM42_12010 [Gemmatales bacterium]|nr:hypothetical protein [Gemmatales bacterium]MDW8222409.1 hypothetical protein [Gemmatales bacterium]